MSFLGPAIQNLLESKSGLGLWKLSAYLLVKQVLNKAKEHIVTGSTECLPPNRQHLPSHLT